MIPVKPYEAAELRAVTGPAIRPGGLALTLRAAGYCNLSAGGRILDVGCGAGATLEGLRQRFPVLALGVDLSGTLLAEARRSHPGLRLVRGDAGALPLAPGQFGTLFCECVLSLLPHPARALGEFKRVLAPAGNLVVADLYRRRPRAGAPAGGGCVRGAVLREKLIQWLESAGFELKVWEDHSRLLKILAAQLVWAGISIKDLWGLDCSSVPSGAGSPWGYGLLVARKRS